ncbi:TIM barrel protein [Paenibacillus sp. NPDC058174]|uniref:TIM barrel protein n=1 Tax=Paenibacillus sp. NPDC058174 TaxID=3346366 RepID=UPI0036DE820B
MKEKPEGSLAKMGMELGRSGKREEQGQGHEQRVDPRLYLAVDNCFASKRWTRPSEWMSLLQSMGVHYVEASADNEIDPLYMGEAYMKRWAEEVREESGKTGVRVANLYSGHGTYATLGLAHPDESVRDRIQQSWVEPMAELAAELGAGLGFYCYAFSEAVLQNPEAYRTAENDLYRRLAEIAESCKRLGVLTPGVEQMYTPHQIPWTIQGAKRLLGEVSRRSDAPFYLTLDTGHQSGQRKFLQPDEETIEAWAEDCRLKGDSIDSSARLPERGARSHVDAQTSSLWLGPQSANTLFAELVQAEGIERTAIMEQIKLEMNRYPYLFAQRSDGDTYRWLAELGCFSPILHLQQTNGRSSSHRPFTEAYNHEGIIFGEPVLRALEKAYLSPAEKGMPPKCEAIYFTLEIFSATSDTSAAILHNIQQSVEYWRQFIPEDGIKLSEALSRLNKEQSNVCTDS